MIIIALNINLKKKKKKKKKRNENNNKRNHTFHSTNNNKGKRHFTKTGQKTPLVGETKKKTTIDNTKTIAQKFSFKKKWRHIVIAPTYFFFLAKGFPWCVLRKR